METIIITSDMLRVATEVSNKFSINRTRFSAEDKIIGVLGELAFAKYLYGEFHTHSETILTTKGQCDFDGEIEIKCSKIPFSNNLNLFVREDYAIKRNPNFYVQLILDVEKDRAIKVGDKIIITGYCSGNDLKAKHNTKLTSTPTGSFNSWLKPIKELNKMNDFRYNYLMALMDTK